MAIPEIRIVNVFEMPTNENKVVTFNLKGHHLLDQFHG